MSAPASPWQKYCRANFALQSIVTLQLFSFPFYNSNPMIEWKFFAVGVHAQFEPLKPELFAAQSGQQFFPEGYLVYAFVGAL